LGAAFPIADNNTYLFYRAGGSGVLVEADPGYVSLYQQHRPRDVVVSAAVVTSGMQAGDRITFYKSLDPGRSTVLAEQARVATQLGKGEVSTFTVPTRTLRSILAEHFADQAPDLVSIDVEGMDHALLQEFDFEGCRPKVIIVENDGGRPVHDELVLSKGYRRFGFTFVNSIYAESAFVEAAAF
ncbi:MAG TPA: FkbM family methyltransferase, partial [Anaeromyxobacter sp.]